jgi:hypothetical protein
MLLMALIWLSMTENPEFLLFVKYLLGNCWLYCCVLGDHGIID